MGRMILEPKVRDGQFMVMTILQEIICSVCKLSVGKTEQG